MRSPRKKYPRDMGYPDLQDGRPPRSSAGAELPDGPVPAEMPGDEAPGDSRPAPRTGAHRAVRGTEPGPARPAAAGGTEARPGSPGSHRMGSGGQHRQPVPAKPAPGSSPWPAAPVHAPAAPDNGTQPPSRPVTGPQDQSWRSSPPAPGPDNGSLLPKQAVTGPQDQAWLSSPPPAVPDSGSRLPSRTGPQHSARPTDHRPPATRPGLTRRPAGDGRSLPQGPAATGPQAPYRARPDDPGDAPPGLAITREPPGARRAAPQQAGSPRDGGRRGPIRGYPPRPGQPDPVYPPGQFSSWNRAATRAAWLGAKGGAGGTSEAEAEPGYSALALSDAAADLTATQTWAVIDDEPPPSPSATRRASRDWGSHAEDVTPGQPRTADGGGAPRGQAIGPRRAHGTGRQAPGSGDRAAARQRRAGGSLAPRPGGPGTDATGPGSSGLAAGATGPNAIGPRARGSGLRGSGLRGSGLRRWLPPGRARLPEH